MLLRTLFVGTALLFGSLSAYAIPEKGYAEAYFETIVPFLNSGEIGLFPTRDGMNLAYIRFVHPNSKGAILVLPGQGEPWLKYGEVLYDLYQKGYSVYSYDHRGQGLSPHLSSKGHEIGHIDRFAAYTEDLEDFIDRILLPPGGESKYFLLAHSMGGAIAADYLSRGKTPFKAAVLSSPMLTINTKPYPRFVGRTLAALAIRYGQDKSYAQGQGDFDPGLPFEKNKVTSSPERFWMSTSVFRSNPRAVIGGVSYGWVYRALKATPKIVRKMKGITTPVLMFQAGRDQFLKSKGQNKGCGSTPTCSIRTFGDSQHEVLMERDVIRDSAMAAVEAFFQ